ncbi:MAG: tRNA (5-methylaminomethyl-2-thiouridine)(34)-methyltransferase MnmD [Chitinophagaceae bacterium]|nr:tRNA (5-methylaminomethyl-2-thiouridine)(34)-methyltransferase MnmD [Chitinophagaceae bacterium]
MNLSLEITGDGSHTLRNHVLQATYHSIHGALQESRHVFIEKGFMPLTHLSAPMPLTVLEVGFGTGLNAILTLQYAEHLKSQIQYTALEPFPPDHEILYKLNYLSFLSKEAADCFFKMHECPWEQPASVTAHFTLIKKKCTLQEFTDSQKFALVYYDAFAPGAQAEMWTVDVFRKLFSHMCGGGLLVTYCSKGEVRRNMISAGFQVEKLPGPPGKKEMLRALKP